MQHSIDYFVGRLRCPHCGRVTEMDLSTNMVTRIRRQPELAYLGPGHPLELDLDSLRDAGYVTLKPPAPGESVRILQSWTCPFCGTFNWAEILVQDGVIAEVTAAPLDLATLRRTHLVEEDVASLTGLPYEQAIHLPDRDFARLLLQAFADAES